jgi:hypothetical protein
MLPGAAVWFLTQRGRKTRIGPWTRWPYLAIAAFVVAYAPVIVYNLQAGLPGVSEASGGRSYLWQPNPSPLAFIQNFDRLVRQLLRQVSGVLEGSEGWESLIGLPLLFCDGPRRVDLAVRRIHLPILAIASQASCRG